jgi:hypothetical protein
MIRDRAQQSWPQLSKTEYGASAANRSRSASAKTMLGLLPPSSRLIFFTLPAARRMISWPVPVSPVNATLPMPMWAAMAAPAVFPGPGDHVEDARRKAGFQRQLGDAQRGEGRVAGGLEDRGIAGRQSGAQLPAGQHEREVPRHDEAHDADRLAQREVEAGLGDGDRLAHQLVRGAGVVLHHVGHGPDLPPRRRDGLAHVAGLRDGQLLEMVADQLREAGEGLAAAGLAPRVPLPVEGGLGGGHGAIDVFGAALGNAGDHLTCDGADDVERLATRGRHLPAADRHLGRENWRVTRAGAVARGVA